MAFPSNMPAGQYSSSECNIKSVNSLGMSNKSECGIKGVFSLKDPFTSDCGYNTIIMAFCQSNPWGVDKLPAQADRNILRYLRRKLAKLGKQDTQYDYLNGVKIHIRG